MSTGHWVVAGVSVAHQHASVDELEAVATDSQRATVRDLLTEPGVEEAFVLQTCNRVEGYVVAADAEVAAAALDSVFAFDAAGEDQDAAVRMGHEESLRHLLRVAAGLESVVLGEDQILGQVRDAYEDARGVGGIGTILDAAVTKAIRVGERARTETSINEGTLSLATAAVSLATEEAALTGETGLVVGAGEMATLAAKSLAETVDRLLVANRTVPHATHVAEATAVDASAIGLDAIPEAVSQARVVVTATNSSEPIVGASAFEDAGETFVVDIAQPRDVPPAVADFDHVTLCDLDTLETVTEETRAERQDAALVVEEIVDEEFDHLFTQYKRKRADRVISAMYESAERVKANELETAIAKADLDAESQAVVESMADAIVSQLLAAPTQSLRDAAEEDDWSTIHTALQLFDPDFGGDEGDDAPPAFVQEMTVDEIPAGMREQMPNGVLEQLDD